MPRDEWITDGGTIANQRYSPLDLIDRGNVAGLKGLWRTGLESGTGPGNSAQAQFLVFESVLYVSTGDNDVFALDVDSGEILWEYRANTDRRAGNPFGRSNRGVALGEGRVFIGQLDAKLVALDQRTGAVLWSHWDYDSPNPIVLFDAEIDGRRRAGLVQVGKTGFAYILDRATGEPLIGIEERAVPQEPRQHTAATQPYPIGDALVPQQIDIPPQRKPGDARLVNGGRIFTPFSTERVMLKPASLAGNMGGMPRATRRFHAAGARPRAPRTKLTCSSIWAHRSTHVDRL